MNTHQWYMMGLVSVQPPNTFIGGVSASIPNASSLATKLGISVDRIENFTIVGSDIKCRITGGSYGSFIFNGDTSITYFRDTDNLVTSLADACFTGCSNLEILEPKGVTTMVSSSETNFSGTKLKVLELPLLTSEYSFANMGFAESIYVPNCTVTSTLYQISGRYAFSVYAHPSLATSNAGGVDANLASFISSGGTVRYVTNLTAPNPVTTLAAGTIYNTAIQLNFTPPSSTNSIDYYECYANGVFKNRISGSGGFITGLTENTNYTITVVAVDVCFNKSTVSNSINTTSSNNTWDISTGLISYYKLDSNSNDIFGSNNGVSTSVSYVSGKVNNAGSYNGSTSKSTIGNPTNLQLSTGSISCWVKASNSGSGYRCIIAKPYAYGLYLADGVLLVYNWGSFGGVGNKTTNINLNDGLWHHVVLVFESGTANNYIYIDGVLILTFSMSVANQSSNLQIGLQDGVSSINALIDETAIYNTKLTQTQIDLLYNASYGITL